MWSNVWIEQHAEKYPTVFALLVLFLIFLYSGSRILRRGLTVEEKVRINRVSDIIASHVKLPTTLRSPASRQAHVIALILGIIILLGMSLLASYFK